MNELKNKHRTLWRFEGSPPDYRFSLANERTYLAWIRTALALLAGAVGIDQLTPELADPGVRIIISSFLCIFSAFVALFSYFRWTHNEIAIRTNKPLVYSDFIKLISFIMVLLSLIMFWVIFK